MSDNPTKRLTITECKQVYSGKSKKTGKDFKIFEVQATNEDGVWIEENLRSFEPLKVGEAAEFEVEKYTGGREVSYTLKPVRGKLGPRVQQLEEAVVALEERIEHLERTAPSGGAGPTRRQEAAEATSEDEDVPF